VQDACGLGADGPAACADSALPRCAAWDRDPCCRRSGVLRTDAGQSDNLVGRVGPRGRWPDGRHPRGVPVFVARRLENDVIVAVPGSTGPSPSPALRDRPEPARGGCAGKPAAFAPGGPMVDRQTIGRPP